MNKAQSRGNAALFSSKNTGQALPKKRSQRCKRADRTDLIDGIVDGERVLIAHSPRPREKAIEIQIRVALAAADVMVMKHNVDHRATFGRGLGLGVADLICVVPPLGRFLAIEVKRPGYSPSDVRDDQQRWLRTVTRYGGIAGVASSVEEAMRLVAIARTSP